MLNGGRHDEVSLSRPNLQTLAISPLVVALVGSRKDWWRIGDHKYHPRPLYLSPIDNFTNLYMNYNRLLEAIRFAIQFFSCRLKHVHGAPEPPYVPRGCPCGFLGKGEQRESLYFLFLKLNWTSIGFN